MLDGGSDADDGTDASGMNESGDESQQSKPDGGKLPGADEDSLEVGCWKLEVRVSCLSCLSLLERKHRIGDVGVDPDVFVGGGAGELVFAVVDLDSGGDPGDAVDEGVAGVDVP